VRYSVDYSHKNYLRPELSASYAKIQTYIKEYCTAAGVVEGLFGIRGAWDPMPHSHPAQTCRLPEKIPLSNVTRGRDQGDSKPMAWLATQVLEQVP
jgi:hypothetical protein